MKNGASARKTVRNSERRAGSHGSAGPEGVAIASPAYGIDAIDSVTTGSDQIQEPQSLESATWSDEGTIQRKSVEPGAGDSAFGNHRENKTGLPDKLKAGIETLSGLAMDDVNVHRNSSKPAQLRALAYTQGTDIHLGPGQERHLPHEAWHVVQQKQDRVKPTVQAKKVWINADKGLEQEADRMGAKATQYPLDPQDIASVSISAPSINQDQMVVQGNFLDHPYWDYEAEHPTHDITYEEWLKKNPQAFEKEVKNLEEESKGVKVEVEEVDDLSDHPYWDYAAEHPAHDISYEEWLKEKNPEYQKEAEEFEESVKKLPKQKKVSTARTSLALLGEAALHIAGAVVMFATGTAGAISLLGAPASVVLYIVAGGQLLIGISKVIRSVLTELKTRADNSSDKEKGKKYKRWMDLLIAGEGAIWAVTATIASIANPLTIISAIGGWIKVLRGLGGAAGLVGPTVAAHMKSAEVIFSVVSSLPGLLAKGIGKGWALVKAIFGYGKQLLKYARTWAGKKELKEAKVPEKEE